MVRTLRWIRGVTAAIGCWWILVTFSPLVDWWASVLAKPWGSGTGEVLVVLGADALADGVLGSSSYLRAVYTVRAMRTHRFRRVIISGGSSAGGRPAPAELMRDFARGQGIDTSDVEVEIQSTTTRENAVRVKSMLGGERGKVVLLTSDYHAWRAFRIFRQLGMEVVPWPVPDVRKRSGMWQARAGLFFELCQETAKIGWYRWKGWI